MDPIKNEHKDEVTAQAPLPVSDSDISGAMPDISALPKKEGEAINVSSVSETGTSTHEIEKPVTAYATHQNVHVEPKVQGFIQPTTDPLQSEYQTQKSVGTATNNIIKFKKIIDEEPAQSATGAKARVELRQDEREELPKAA
jgi:hypothetical protein